MGDPRVSNAAGFTATLHQTVPDYLDPGKVILPEGYTACIIGASAGIGEHIAYALAAAKASTLILCARNTSKLARVASHITDAVCANHKTKPTIHVQQCDLADPSSIAELATYIRTNVIKNGSGRLDAVIPNASYAPPVTGMKVTQNSPEEVRKAFDTNFLGTYSVAHHFIPIMQESMRGQGGKGQFFVVGSLAGCLTKGIIANTGYTISKMAQIRLVEYVDEQFGKVETAGNQAILAVVIHPGAVATDMADGNTPEEFIKYLVDDVGLCGAMLTWLAAAEKGHVDWLGGRLISAKWDVKELMAKREEVLKGDLLKFELVTK